MLSLSNLHGNNSIFLTNNILLTRKSFLKMAFSTASLCDRSNMKKIVILISLISLSLVGMRVYSQEPPPPVTQRQPRENPSERSTTSNIKTNDNASQNRMPKIIPKIHTDSSDASAQNAYEKDSERWAGITKDDPITTYTFFLMLFTGLLVFCNILLWLSTKKSADAAKKSIELIKQEFITTHKPRLRVHSIYLEKLSSTPNFTNGSPPITHQINCSIDNIGRSTATIIKISMTFRRLNDPLPVPSYGKPLFIKKTIACGESTAESCNVGAFVINCNIERGIDDLYFFGYIDYLDDIGTTRRTAFCRRYIQETKRFTKVDDEEYEYSY